MQRHGMCSPWQVLECLQDGSRHLLSNLKDLHLWRSSLQDLHLSRSSLQDLYLQDLYLSRSREVHSLQYLKDLGRSVEVHSLCPGQCLCLAYLQVLQALLPFLQLAMVSKVEDMQLLLLLQRMECKTLGICGGRQEQVLQHLSEQILKVALFLQITNSRPLGG